MSDFDKYTRVNKFEKRRKNTKSISIFLLIGGILLIVLLGIWIFGGGDDEASQDPDDDVTGTNETNDESETDKNKEENSANDEETSEDESISGEDNTSRNMDSDDSTEDEESDDQIDEQNNDTQTEQIENPDDDNVLEAYTGNWEPIGTEQSGPHTTEYDKESQDWLEMERAIKYATGIHEMTTHWIGNGGDQKVIGTVSPVDDQKIYRVHLSWIETEGWKPTKVEILKEPDLDNE